MKQETTDRQAEAKKGHVPTQKEMVLEHLEKFGTIEPLTALKEYGCYRLGARIADLREEGYVIETKNKSAKSAITGRTVNYAEYWLKSAQRG